MSATALSRYVARNPEILYSILEEQKGELNANIFKQRQKLKAMSDRIIYQTLQKATQN